jgi:hypothetical protein
MATRGLVRAAGSCCSTGARRTIDWRIVASGKRTPSWLQNDDAHAPPASTAVRVLMVPASVTTPLSRPPSISMPRAAQFWCTVPPSFISAAATAGAALAGSPVPSLGEKTPPFHARPVAWPALRGLAAAEHVRGHADRLREFAPLGPAGDLGFVIAEVQQAAATEAGVFAAVGGKLFPEFEAPGRHRQFAGVAVLLTAPAPVAARLFGADAALFDHGDRQPAPGQVVRGEDTDDAAADHDDVGAGRQVGRSLDKAQGLGHGCSRCPLQARTSCTT